MSGSRPRRRGLVLVALVVVAAAAGATWVARRGPGGEGKGGPPAGPSGRAPDIAPPLAPSRAAARRVVPRPGADGRIEVPVTDQVPARLPAAAQPVGWDLKEFSGKADIEILRDEGLALRLRSQATSFALHRDVVVDLARHPVLSWAWKAVRLPARGDVRARSTDDQAAQVYVVFPRWPSPQTRSEVLGYVWDTGAPEGTALSSPQAPNVRIVVVASGRDGLGEWRAFRRDVARDYAALFGRPAPRVGKVALMIDSNDTRSEAEVLVKDLRFGPGVAERVETPTPMLR